MGKAAVVQSAPNDPRVLLAPENRSNPTFLHDKFHPILGGLAGYFGTTLHNYSMRRPLHAGLPLVVAATVGGVAVGVWWHQRNEAYFAEREAVYRHYMELHPEDFPAIERVLVGDMFKPWVPIR